MEVLQEGQGQNPDYSTVHILTFSCIKIQDLAGEGTELMAINCVQSAWPGVW